MRRVAAGDRDAFALVYDAHAAPAFGLALRLLGDQAVAEDVVQEAFLSAWRQAARFDPGRGSLRAWLLTIVHHRAVDQQRRQSRTVPVSGDDAGLIQQPAASETFQEAMSSVTAASVRQALAGLPREQQQCLELAYFGGLPHGEIATRLGLPLGTVKGRIRLAMVKLRGVLADWQEDLPDD